MQTGRTIENLAAELDRQHKTKVDLLSRTSNIKMFVPEVVNEEIVRPMINITGDDVNSDFGINSTAHEQIATHTGVHKKYYDRMLSEAPELLATNVNHWLHKNEEARMIRTLDGNVRAVLSPRYRALDHYDLFTVIAGEFLNYKGELQLVSSEVTERRLYMKFAYPALQREVKLGDVVTSGVTIGNSEIGSGRVTVEPWIYRLRCLNGMTIADSTLKKNHIGRALDDFEEATRYFADETRKADDRAFFLKVRDVFKAALGGEIFEQQVRLLQESTTKEVTGDIEGAVQVLATRSLFTEEERSAVLNHFVRDGDLTKYGLAQAVTRSAHDIADYDRATQFEKIGGEVIVMPQYEWKAIAEAGRPEEKKRRRRGSNLAQLNA